MVLTGQWSLQVFSLGAVLGVLVTAIFEAYSPTRLSKLAFNMGAILLTALVVVLLVFHPWKRLNLVL